MTDQEAIAIAEQQRAALEIPASHPLVGAHPVWIEVGQPDVTGQRLVRDVYAWRVTFDSPPGPSLVIDDATGEILRTDWIT